MAHDRLARARRLVRRAAAAGIIAALFFIPFAGRALVAEDPLVRADAVFVLAGARAERWLEGVDLYREGWAPRILLSNARLEQAEARVRGLGIRYPSPEEAARDAIRQLGVPEPAVAIMPGGADNTAQEASFLRSRATAEQWKTVIVVTSKYHTRRARFAFARTFKGSGIQIVMHGSRYDAANPGRWWSSRADIRFVGSELPKLLLYWVGLAG